ncbi:MAG: transposase [Pikeienuella sp.]
MRSTGSFGRSEDLERLNKYGDPLEVPEATVVFEHLQHGCARSVIGPGWSRGSAMATARKGDWAPLDPVLISEAMILKPHRNLSDARMEFMICDRLSWMRFLGFDLGAPTPGENTIRHFRNRLAQTAGIRSHGRAHGRADPRCLARAGAETA